MLVTVVTWRAMRAPCQLPSPVAGVLVVITLLAMRRWRQGRDHAPANQDFA